MTYGNVRMTLADDLVRVDVGGTLFELSSAKITLSTGGSSIEMTDAGVKITGARIDLN